MALLNNGAVGPNPPEQNPDLGDGIDTTNGPATALTPAEIASGPQAAPVDPVLGYTPYFNPATEVPEGEGNGTGDFISQPSSIGGGVLSPALDTGLAPTTRDLQDPELTSFQLNKLLEQDGTYIRNARNRGAQLANRRGALSSSLFAGASQQAAIEAALPIAQDDARANQLVASQNMQALNTFTNNMLQRATALDTAKIGATAQITTARIGAESRALIANIQRMTSIDTANISANAGIHIANLNAEIKLRLQEMNDASNMARLIESGEIDLSNKLILGDIERDNANRLAELNAYANLNNQYIQLQTNMVGQDLIAAAAARASAGIEDWMASQIKILDRIYQRG